MNECHMALTITHIREKSKGQTESVVWPKSNYLASVRPGLFFIYIIYLFLFFFNFYFYTILKVTFYLQLLQNIDYIPCVVQYILEPILYPIVCISPSLFPLVTTSLFSISVSLFLFCYVNSFIF